MGGSIPAWAGEPSRQPGRGPQGALRSIPAWAGEPRCGRCIRLETAVYPRVGGGTGLFRCQCWLVGGLSPRGRGNPAPMGSMGRLSGSIPAWAGEPGSYGVNGQIIRVYPRVGGGTYCEAPAIEDDGGLSPRGRGNHTVHSIDRPFDGSIPAWAGEPTRRQERFMAGAVYPRVGGGTCAFRCANVPGWGLSPRGRGNLPEMNRKLVELGSIPAWAGEPRGSPPRLD